MGERQVGHARRKEGTRQDELRDQDHSFPRDAEHSQGGQSEGPNAHVVLYQPEIPQNTGNIGRTCVAVGAKLWLVHPMGFQLDEKRVRRAGLDYWKHLDWTDVADWQELRRALPQPRMFFLSRFAERTVWDAELRRGDVFVFGRETAGLPASILDPKSEFALRLPTSPFVRSLNLATTVGIVMYEHLRQTQLRETT